MSLELATFLNLYGQHLFYSCHHDRLGMTSSKTTVYNGFIQRHIILHSGTWLLLDVECLVTDKDPSCLNRELQQTKKIFCVP